MEIDHIIQQADGGPDTEENGIPVCFECHAEIHMYNDKHPRGRKFQPEELKKHKEEWFRICKEKPELFAVEQIETGAGPINAMIDELEFNTGVKQRLGKDIGCPFEVRQFDRLVDHGIFSLLPDQLREALRKTYIELKRANGFISALRLPNNPNQSGDHFNNTIKAIQEVEIASALDILKQYLQKPD